MKHSQIRQMLHTCLQIWEEPINSFHGAWLHFRWITDAVCVFGAAVCKIKTGKHYKVKGSLYSCLLTAHLPSRSRILNLHLETVCEVVSGGIVHPKRNGIF